MSKCIQIADQLLLSYSFISKYDISYHTIKKWAERKQYKPFCQDNEAYILYDIIPLPSRSKLPTESELLSLLKEHQKGNLVQNFHDKLKYAQTNKFIDYRPIYRDKYGFDANKSLQLAMKRAVWERVMQLRNEENSEGYKGGLKKGVLETLFKAYDKLYPGQYSCKHSFSRAVKTILVDGVDAVIVDKRLFGSQHNKQFTELHEYFVRSVIGIGKAYNSVQIQQRVAEMCREANVSTPSISWIKTYKQNLLNNFDIHSTRYGHDATNKLAPYAGIQPALYADDQYQIDGWDLPFYYLDENRKLKKLTLIAIRDAYSKRIVGYSICRSENRLSILDAFQDAVSNTGCLPFEIVFDNHSFNKTKEADNFITQIKSLGVTYTIDENPQRKAIAERGFKKLGEQFCKDHYGYIGQGIKTKEKDGRTSPEMLDSFLKSGKVLSETEIKMIAVEVVMRYNSTKLNATTQSPDVLYNDSSKPHRIELDLFERLRLFTKRTEYKISRGQINIQIAGKDYQYQVNAQIYKQYNNKQVTVRYDTTELIYLFDKDTDSPIGAIEQKTKIHGAKANQTENDIILLNKNKGRTKGIKSQARKENEDIVKAALAHNPNAIEIMNHWTTPKDVLKEAESNYLYAQECKRRGIDINMVTTVPKVTEVTNSVFTDHVRTKRERSPFAVLDNEIRVIDPSEFDN